jgi:ArsR family transcriptional regulator
MNDLVDFLRAIAEPTRLRLLALCAQGELTVGELAQILGQSQPRVSRHVRLLCDAGLLERLPEGSWVFLRLARTDAASLIAKIIALIPPSDPIAGGDRARLAEVRRARDMAANRYFAANAERWNDIRTLHVDEAEVEKALIALLPPDDVTDLLDIGTGAGRILELFGERGVKGAGVDLSHAMLTVARANLTKAKLGDCYVRHGDMYRLPWTEPCFDAVTIHQVLHYADDPGAAISEAARVLRPGGRLVVGDFAPHRLERLRTDHSHRRLGFSDDEVVGWLRTAGLRPGRIIKLPAEPLTVKLWSADHPASRRAARSNA